jgi:hypothetical protein
MVRCALRSCVILMTVALGGAIGCARLPPCPDRGGPRWSEWATPNFRILTDLDEAEAETAADDLEELHATLLAVAWRGAPAPGRPIRAVLLRDRVEMSVFAPSRVEGMFTHGGPFGGMIVSSAFLSSVDRDVLRHELVHALAARFGLGGNAPPWLAEGLAEYLSTVQHEHATGRLVFGGAAPRYMRLLLRGGSLAFDNLWRKPAPDDVSWFYATSWLLVHYLFNHHPARMEAFQGAIALGDSARDAWDTRVGLKAAEVDQALDAYLKRGTFVTRALEIKSAGVSMSERRLSDAEVHGLRALLYAGAWRVDGDRRELVRSEVTEALRQDPLDLWAVGVQRLYLVEQRGDVATAERLVRRHPGEPLAWVVLSVARTTRDDPDGADAALEQARKLGYRDRVTAPDILAPPRLQ